MEGWLYIAFAGALGSLGRYGVGLLSHRLWGSGFPLGTLIVNVSGCFLIGFISQTGLGGDLLSKPLRQALTVGFLGGFTTFSSFGNETVRSMERGDWTVAFLNVAANLVFGLLAAWIGLALGRATVGQT